MNQDDDDTCLNCGKSISHVHPWEEFNCWCGDLLSFTSNTSDHGSRIVDLEVGEKLVYLDVIYIKANNSGWSQNSFNLKDMEGTMWRLHPATIITRMQ
jgi:hypothetical protein